MLTPGPHQDGRPHLRGWALPGPAACSGRGLCQAPPTQQGCRRRWTRLLRILHDREPPSPPLSPTRAPPGPEPPSLERLRLRGAERTIPGRWTEGQQAGEGRLPASAVEVRTGPTLLGAVCPRRQQVAADGAGALLRVGGRTGQVVGCAEGPAWHAGPTGRASAQPGRASCSALPPYLRASSSLLPHTAPAIC